MRVATKPIFYKIAGHFRRKLENYIAVTVAISKLENSLFKTNSYKIAGHFRRKLENYIAVTVAISKLENSPFKTNSYKIKTNI